MKFNVIYLGVDQDVDLGWLSGIADVVEMMRIMALEVGDSLTLRHHDMGGVAASEPFHVTRVS